MAFQTELNAYPKEGSLFMINIVYDQHYRVLSAEYLISALSNNLNFTKLGKTL